MSSCIFLGTGCECLPAGLEADQRSDQQPASRMKKQGTWVVKCSPNRAGSGGCGCERGGGLKGLFIDRGSWLERVSVDRICGGINFGERIVRNRVRTAEL